MEGIRPSEASSSIYRGGWLLAQVPPFTRVSMGEHWSPLCTLSLSILTGDLRFASHPSRWLDCLFQTRSGPPTRDTPHAHMISSVRAYLPIPASTCLLPLSCFALVCWAFPKSPLSVRTGYSSSADSWSLGQWGRPPEAPQPC